MAYKKQESMAHLKEKKNQQKLSFKRGGKTFSQRFYKQLLERHSKNWKKVWRKSRKQWMNKMEITMKV